MVYSVHDSYANEYFWNEFFNFQNSYSPWPFQLGQYGFDENNLQYSKFKVKPYSSGDRTMLYMYDEPLFSDKDLAAINRTKQVIKDFKVIVDNTEIILRDKGTLAWDEDIPIYISARYFAEDMAEDMIDEFEIWGIRHYNIVTKENINTLLANDRKLLYTMDDEYCLDTPLLTKERFLSYLCFNNNVSGFEYFDILNISDDPFFHSSVVSINKSTSAEGNPYWYGKPGDDSGKRRSLLHRLCC